MSVIKCKCEKCSIFLNEPKVLYSLFCACEDCRQAGEWGYIKGGNKPEKIQKLIYLRSDIIKTKGLEFMQSYQLRENADSTRIYCDNCYSMIGVDHRNYKDILFMVIPNLCNTDIKDNTTPLAVIQMQDYVFGDKPNISNNIKLIQTYNNKITRDFKPRYQKPVGISIRELISKISGPTILDLKKGERLIN